MPNQTDLPGETERALRALTCKWCYMGLEIIVNTLTNTPVHWKGLTVTGICTYNPDLLPLFNAAVEQAHSQDEKFTYCAYCGHREAVDVDGSVIAQHIRTCEKHPAREWERQAVAGAYAAAAKACDDAFTEAMCDRKLGIEACLQAALAAIRSLTPADARQASQQLERMACGHLKADEITICDDMGCIQDSHQREYNLDCRCGGRWVTKCGICAAIASAEARARLELIERIVHYKKEFHEVGSRESNAIQFILNQIQLDRLAAASTPDRPTAVDGTCCSCGYSGEDETPCPKQEDGHHCIHWYEGESPDSTKEPE